MTTTNIQKNTLEIIDCGLTQYTEVLQRQFELRDARREGQIPDTVLITEHKPVITLGARQSANRFIADRQELAKKGVDVVKIRRGGGATAHNPGQLVFYPIMNLQELGLGISDYIRLLEEIGIELLGAFRVKAQRRKGYPGLWVDTGDKRKIASIGVRVSKFVTYHGMAINVNNDLGIFDYIVPCGLDEVEMTSVLKETDEPLPMDKMKDKLAELLREHLDRKEAVLNPKRPRVAGGGRRLPGWLKRPLPASSTSLTTSGHNFSNTESVLEGLGLETICVNANCPNRGQCWSRGTATVLILGNVCTRNCKFCSVGKGKPKPVDPTEAGRLAEMAERMKLKYLVITSVDRDDLADGGAGHFRDCINTVRRRCPDMQFEILVPDFRECQTEAIEVLKGALPFVFAHNVETVPSLYGTARSGGDYEVSLNLLRLAKETYPGVATKSSIMLGLGETDQQVEGVLRDLRSVGCERITIGQYLKPAGDCLEVVEYVTPDKFEYWKNRCLELGFGWVISSPFARSSYFAEQEEAK